MKKLHNAHGRLVVALLASIVAIPMSMTALLLSSPQDKRDAMTGFSNAASVSGRAKERAEERKRWNAVEEFQKANAVHGDAMKPSAESSEQTAGTTGASDVSSLTTDALTAVERALLRTYTRSGSCPESLKVYPVLGLYELCIAIVGSGAADSLPSGLLNHTAYLKRTLTSVAPDLPEMTLRLKTIQEALIGTKRDGGAVPGRPTKGY